MKRRPYIPRIADSLLSELLSCFGAVLIEGPRWCGKTRTALEASESAVFMGHPETYEENILRAGLKPSSMLVGEIPRLIDEWQVSPNIWDAVRHEVDMRQSNGQFILTGSTTPPKKSMKHTGIGRIARLLMRTMSLFESGDSNGSVSMRGLFENGKVLEPVDSRHTLGDVANWAVRGGWPSAIGYDPKVGRAVAKQYVESIIRNDMALLDGVNRNQTRVESLLKAVARNVSTQASIETIKSDIEGGDTNLSITSVHSYLDALRKIFVVEDLPAWSPHMRSKASLRFTPKRHFVDPSIGTATQKLTGESLLKDLRYFGQVFESLCVRDFRVYADTIYGSVYHYRDKNGLEVDTIVDLGDGRWGAFEVKLGVHQYDEAAENLLKFKSKIDEDKMRPPSFLAILTAKNLSFTRDDGVSVVSIGNLGP